MKTQTDKSSPRPWRNYDGRIYGPNPHGDDEILVADVSPGGAALTEYDGDNANLIVQAVNEYDALNAVAEAAKKYAGLTTDCCMGGEATGEVCELHQALALLDAVRSQNKK